MAEPISFAASIAALSSLAGNVAWKSYKYLKAVKDCREDVRRLVAETSALSGILFKLDTLLGGSKLSSTPHNAVACRKCGNLSNDTSETRALDSNSESDENDAETPDESLKPPSFVIECRKILEEIQGILHRFGQPRGSSKQSPQSAQKSWKFSLSTLRRLEPNDLKWPLTNSKTLKLIHSLERHKSTCTMALVGDGLTGIHSLLNQTELSNKHLVELRKNQETILRLQLNDIEGR